MMKEKNLDKLNEKNNYVTQESSADGSNLMHENYMKLKKIAEGLLNGRYSYMKFNAPGFMDLVAEKYGVIESRYHITMSKMVI